jgi:hypothetical protein
MCALPVTRHTSIRYSSSCHTRVNMGASIFFTAAMIRALGQRGHVAMVRRTRTCFLVMNVCNHEKHYETSGIIIFKLYQHVLYYAKDLYFNMTL